MNYLQLTKSASLLITSHKHNKVMVNKEVNLIVIVLVYYPDVSQLVALFKFKV